MGIQYDTPQPEIVVLSPTTASKPPIDDGKYAEADALRPSVANGGVRCRAAACDLGRR
jgi:hypothetical protein